MAGPSHKLIEAIFLEVIEAVGPAREEILRQRCDGDAQLRSRVERLIAADEENSSDGTIGEGVAEFPSDPVPRQIAAYKIVGIAGEGGMGAVYDAVHEPTGRRAAVKLMRAGISGRRGFERMRIEAETLGRLNSPYIAQVYDAGVADITYADGARASRPFIAMEFVDGVSILEHIRDHQLSLAQQLLLFEGVARAVHHAHQRGVIHRDLKPSNILVTDDGVPKVVDFGIARLVDLATGGITVDGQVLGTVRYMSPEQASGDPSRIDTRTDVYAVGAVLYEAIAGQPILELGEGSSIGALMRVLNTVPQRLKTLKPKVPHDLDAIVHRAIERDVEHRYGSAQMLADDLERFRTGREVTARAPRTIERVIRVIRRNVAISAAAAVAVVAIVVGAAVSVWQARVAIRQEQATARALGEARASLDYLSDLLASCTPERDGRDARVLDVAIKAATDIEGRFKDRPLVLSEVRLSLGRTFLALGKREDAFRELDAAHEQRLALLGPDDVRTVEAEAALDDAALTLGLKKSVGRDFERPRLWFAEHVGPDDRRTLRAQLTAAEARAVLATGPDPFALVEATADAFERVYGPADDDTLAAQSQRAFWLLDRRNDPERAAALLEPVLELETQRFGPSNARTLDCARTLAGAWNVLGQSERAIALLEPKIPAYIEVFGEGHPQTVLAERALANALADAGHNDRAEAAYQRAIDASVAAFGPRDGRTQSIRIRLAECYTEEGRLDEAEAMIRRVLDEEMAAQVPAPHYGLAMAAQGRLLLARGRPAEAVIRFEGAIAVFAADHTDRTRADAVEGLGECMMKLGRPTEAAACFGDAAEAYSRRLGEAHANTRRARAEFAEAEVASGAMTRSVSERAIGDQWRDKPAAWQVRVAAVAIEEGRAELAASWLERAAAGSLSGADADLLARLRKAAPTLPTTLPAR